MVMSVSRVPPPNTAFGLKGRLNYWGHTWGRACHRACLISCGDSPRKYLIPRTAPYTFSTCVKAVTLSALFCSLEVGDGVTRPCAIGGWHGGVRAVSAAEKKDISSYVGSRLCGCLGSGVSLEIWGSRMDQGQEFGPRVYIGLTLGMVVLKVSSIVLLWVLKSKVSGTLGRYQAYKYLMWPLCVLWG